MKILSNPRRQHKILLFLLFIIIIIFMGRRFFKYQSNTPYQPSLQPLDKIISHGVHNMDSIHVVVTSCGQDPAFLDMTLVLLKSTVTLTRTRVHFIILTDYMGVPLHLTMQTWPSHTKSGFSYEIRPIEYPGIAKKDLDEWVYMFKACSTQRLFIPKMLPNIDSVLYIDADTLLLDDIRHLWSHFSKFDENQIAGISEEVYHPDEPFVPVPEGHPPLAGPRSGLNAGVILMNLTRMREFGWVDRILPIYKKYGKLLYADQGIINVIFHDNLEKLYLLPCRWNYWDGHCSSGNLCQSAEDFGVGVLHHTGFDWCFAKELHSAVYGPFLYYNFEDDMTKYLVSPMKKQLGYLKGTSKCGDNAHVFTKGLELAVQRLKA